MNLDLDKIIFKSIKKDKIDLNCSGFHWVSHGRSGYIYFVENTNVLPIAIEMPGVDYLDVLVFGEIEHLSKRYNPKKYKVEELTIEERKRIQKRLVNWLNEKGLRHDLKISNY
ncbi:hypothetical protein RB620_29845 [Paenibacillus sp. LHD-117]|uniref:hypothetical protein n=1 Tax=Paenibacillus sp. LHD-117 TaxID=3071412 RepID=UPI0027DEB4FD|nr:hypothetical protein [Paenibacillus sp. LHD-117]MDQ6423618.1 hypothetical protein [Paenibacillus sp. LHD-117]